MAMGEVEAAPGNTFDVPNLGEREFRDLSVVITGPPTVFTADNIGEFDF
jgi:rhamnose transport system substrate-binding protein